MTAFRAVLMKPLAEQHDRDGNFIDPNVVAFDADEEYPIWRDFSYDTAKDIVGSGKVRREEDGSLVVEGELTINVDTLIKEDRLPFTLAIGVISDRSTLSKESARTVERARLFSIGFTASHTDPDQPQIEIIRRGT